MAEDFFEKVGGIQFFTDLVRDFYRQVPADPILGPMYPLADMEGAETRLRLFLIQYWGGPADYHELRGHPRLRMRHMEFAIDKTARDHWISLMTNAVKLQKLPAELEKELMEYLQQTARILINTGESEQIKWGNPNGN